MSPRLRRYSGAELGFACPKITYGLGIFCVGCRLVGGFVFCSSVEEHVFAGNGCTSRLSLGADWHCPAGPGLLLFSRGLQSHGRSAVCLLFVSVVLLVVSLPVLSRGLRLPPSMVLSVTAFANLRVSRSFPLACLQVQRVSERATLSPRAILAFPSFTLCLAFVRRWARASSMDCSPTAPVVDVLDDVLIDSNFDQAPVTPSALLEAASYWYGSITGVAPVILLSAAFSPEYLCSVRGLSEPTWCYGGFCSLVYIARRFGPSGFLLRLRRPLLIHSESRVAPW